MSGPADIWAARKQRAMEHTKRLMEECQRAREKKTTPKHVEYVYDDEPRRREGGADAA